jgi:hypothetical protein
MRKKTSELRPAVAENAEDGDGLRRAGKRKVVTQECPAVMAGRGLWQENPGEV